MWINGMLLVIVIICVITDLLHRKIYNNVIFPGLLLAFTLHVIMGGWSSLFESLLGFVTGLGILIIPYVFGGMGAGDVKLLALIGAMKGIGFVVMTSIYMAFIGALLAIILIIVKNRGSRLARTVLYGIYALSFGIRLPFPRQKMTARIAYPYGVAIAGGTILSFLLKERIFP